MGTIPEGGLPKAELKQSINNVNLIEILDETADALDYVLDAHSKVSHKHDKVENLTYSHSAEIDGHFYSRKNPSQSVAVHVTGDEEKRTKTPYYNFIEIVKRDAADTTEEYVEQGRKIIQTFLESYRKHGFQSGDGGGGGGSGA